MLLPEQVLRAFERGGFRLALAESITGGAIAAELVSISGASKVLLGSIVAYDTAIKSEVLGVPAGLLANYGAVHPEIALAMAEGVGRLFSPAVSNPDSVVALGITGVAGPECQDGAPVGQVFIAISSPQVEAPSTFSHHFEGNRTSIREQSVSAALQHLLEFVAS